MQPHSAGVAERRFDFMHAVDIGPAVTDVANIATHSAPMPAQISVLVIRLPLACGPGTPSHWSIITDDCMQIGNKIQAGQGFARNAAQTRKTWADL